MLNKNLKRFLAATLTTAMVLGGNVLAFAETTQEQANAGTAQDATGTGGVEYNNATDITYDSIVVPLISDNTFDFVLDPSKMLYEYDSETYNADDTVYFTKAIKAKIDVKKTSDDNHLDLFKKGKDKVTLTGGTYPVTMVTLGSGGAIDSVEDGYYVWVPKVNSSNEPTGEGDYKAITKDNIETYLVVALNPAKDTVTGITMKTKYKSGTALNVCDGELYKDKYEALTSDDEFVLDDDQDFVTLNTDGDAVATAPGLYSDDEGTPITTDVSKIVIIPAENKKVGTTTEIKVTNKSTKAKKVSVVVTLENADGLEINDSTTFADNKARVYFAVTNGGSEAGDTKVLAKNSDGVVTATYSKTIAKADNDPNTFQIETPLVNNTGSHQYVKYEKQGTTYHDDKFYITAAANATGNSDDKIKAWKDYYDALAAKADPTKRPKLKIVYKVANDQTGKTITFNANYDDADPATATATTDAEGKVTAPNTITRTNYDIEGWYTDPECTAANKKDLSTDTFTADTTLYAKWTAKNVAPSATATQAVLESGKTADITVDLGLGNLAATGVTSFVNKGLGNDWIAAGAASYSNGKITLLKTTDVDYLLGAGSSNNVFTITFNDGAVTTVDVTLSAKE